jgi:micrococcal nuclease
MIVAVASLVLMCACVDNDDAASQSASSPRVPTTVALTTAPARIATTESPAANVPSSCTPPYPSGPPTASTVFCADPSTMQRASVVRIVDGDTLRALVDGVEEPVRLFGVDTPERGDPCFAEAADVLRLQVALHRGEVLLVPDARNRDRYDRLLRYVYTPDGLSIDALLIAAGFGRAWTQDGALRDPLIELEATARAQHRGCLWG